MNRKRRAQQLRKNIMKLGTIVQEEILNKDDDGTIWPDKRDWGYCVRAVVNGWHISAPDDCWYEAYKGCLEAAKWAMDQKPGRWTPEGVMKDVEGSSGQPDS